MGILLVMAAFGLLGSAAAIPACSESPDPPDAAAPLTRIFIDQAHHNLHTTTRNYATLVALLREERYAVEPLDAPFSSESLPDDAILVISNARMSSDPAINITLSGSAFTESEITAVRQWVADGGSLLLVTDHMPVAGQAAELAAAFDVTFHNGFAMPEDWSQWRKMLPMFFRRADATLADHVITRGRSDAERIESVATFTGQAFEGPDDLQPLLVFGPGATLLMPDRPWQFTPQTPSRPIEGWLQAGVMPVGRGRVAIFGEAGMFTLSSEPETAQNRQFILNVFAWLSGSIEHD